MVRTPTGYGPLSPGAEVTPGSSPRQRRSPNGGNSGCSESGVQAPSPPAPDPELLLMPLVSPLLPVVPAAGSDSSPPLAQATATSPKSHNQRMARLYASMAQ